MEELTYYIVEGQIGYNFKNRDLLQQAFVRRSYAKENGGADNEVLEFIGDKVLDICVVQILTERFGYMASQDKDFDVANDYNEFWCECTEGRLTELKTRMVEKKNLAQRIDELGFADFLIMGKGDSKNNISQSESVKEDLFEAILGAVALDTSWDFKKLKETVEIMLVPENILEDGAEDNYVQLIQEWELQKNGVIPWYKYFKRGYQLPWYDSNTYKIIRGKSPSVIAINGNEQQYICQLKLLEDLPIFEAYGTSKSNARKEVCKLAYEYLDKEGRLFTIQDEIENPNINDAISQLEILARRGYFSLPLYEFREDFDENGNPVWTAECHIDEEEYYFDATDSSKKAAKKQAAYDMLMYVLGYDEEDE